MRKRFRLALAMLAVAIVGVAGWLLWPPGEPVYQGKRLSFWLRGYDYTLYSQWAFPIPPYLSAESPAKANEAVRAAGTNAIPTLLKLLQTRDLSFSLRVRNWLLNSKYRNPAIKRGLMGPASDAWLRQHEGRAGMLALGANAAGAVPGLVKLCDRNSDPDFLFWAVEEFRQMGPAAKPAIPTLIRLATFAGTNQSSIPSVFLDSQIRIQSCYALAFLHAEPELTLPAMVRALQDPDKRVQFAALLAIGAFRTEARPAVPALVELIKRDSNQPPGNDQEFKASAKSILRMIDPEAAAQMNIAK
jgi:HEAT repeats